MFQFNQYNTLFSLFQNIPRHFLTFLNCLFVCIFEILIYWTVTAKSNGSNIKMAKRKGPWYKERKNQIIIGLCTCILIALVVLVVLAAIFITKDKEEGTKILRFYLIFFICVSKVKSLLGNNKIIILIQIDFAVSGADNTKPV